MFRLHLLSCSKYFVCLCLFQHRHCFLVGANKSYVIATSDLWLFIYASNLLPSLPTPLAYTTNEDIKRYYYKRRRKMLLLQTKTQTVIITNEDKELYDYKRRHKLLLLQTKTQNAVTTNKDTNCYYYKLRHKLCYFLQTDTVCYCYKLRHQMSVLDESFSSVDHVCMQCIAYIVVTNWFICCFTTTTTTTKCMHICSYSCIHTWNTYVHTYNDS